MAQPSMFVLKYVDVMEVTAGVPYSGASITTGNIMQMKSKGISVVLNSSGIAFPITYDDLNYVDDNTTYTFDKACIVAICSMAEVV